MTETPPANEEKPQPAAETAPAEGTQTVEQTAKTVEQDAQAALTQVNKDLQEMKVKKFNLLAQIKEKAESEMAKLKKELEAI